MMNLNEMRDIGQYPISIATSLALEGAAGIYPEREHQKAVILEGVREIWFNIGTLARNCLNAFRKEHRSQLMPPKVYEALKSDLMAIESVVIQIGEGRVVPRFYHCDYTPIPRLYPKANLRKPNTEIQRTQDFLEQGTMELLAKEGSPVTIMELPLSFPRQYPHCWLVTHYPIDLLNRTRFSRLELLESHTGMVKPMSQWYSKLANAKEYDFLPFNRFTLQLFGDNVLFTGFSPKLKSRVVEIAKERGWNPTTSLDRIRDHVRKLPAEDRDLLLSLF